MAYLPTGEIILDAILTKEGRKALADGSFAITQVAFSDDEIDYTLYDPSHPSGSAFFGESIRMIPINEATPDGNQLMKSRLVTLPRGTSRLPVVSVGLEQIVLKQGASIQISPSTLNFGASTESSGYAITVSDSRLLSSFKGIGLLDIPVIDAITPGVGARLAHTENGITFTLTASTAATLFTGSVTQLTTSVEIVGRDSGARISVPLVIQKKS